MSLQKPLGRTIRHARLPTAVHAAPAAASRRSRGFHSSRPNALLNEALQASHALFQTVHDCSGLSWSLSIPLTAVLCRAGWLPVQWLLDRNSKKRAAIQPLLLAYRNMYRVQARAKFGRGEAGQEEKTAIEATRWVGTQLRQRRREMERRHVPLTRLQAFGVQLSFLPVWLLNTEVIRRMSGDDRTLLSLFSGDTAAAAAAKVDTSVVPVESGFLAESVLWVPNLVAADQLWLLPLAFAGLQLLNARVAFGGLRGRQSTGDLPPLVARALKNFAQLMQVVPFIMAYGLIQGEMPVAVVLYLIGSAGSMLAQRAAMTVLAGKTEVVRPWMEKAPEPIPGMQEAKQEAMMRALKTAPPKPQGRSVPDVGLRTKSS